MVKKNVKKSSLDNLKVIRTSERGRELGSRPKKNTANMSLARKIDWLKRKGLTDEKVQEFHDMITDEDVTDVTILEYIKTLKDIADKSEDPKELRGVVDLLIKWRKERFGKTRIEGKIDVDWSGDVNRILKACEVVDAEFEDVEDDEE